MVAVDACSQWGELKALPDKYAATVADVIVDALLANTAIQDAPNFLKWMCRPIVFFLFDR